MHFKAGGCDCGLVQKHSTCFRAAQLQLTAEYQYCQSLPAPGPTSYTQSKFPLSHFESIIKSFCCILWLEYDLLVFLKLNSVKNKTVWQSHAEGGKGLQVLTEWILQPKSDPESSRESKLGWWLWILGLNKWLFLLQWLLYLQKYKPVLK